MTKTGHSEEIIKPFRWDVSRRERLGSLLDGPAAIPYDAFFSDLRDVSARVIGLGGDHALYFVGRSPEPLFDYLGGILLDMATAERLELLQISTRFQSPESIARADPGAERALRPYLTALGLDPAHLCNPSRRALFVDVVASGSTFGNIVGLLKRWSDMAGVNWKSVQRRIGFIGLTAQEKTSPKTWRWHQHQDWIDLVPDAVIKNVPIPMRLFGSLAGDGPKVTESYPSWRWGDSSVAAPPRAEENLAALRLAVELFDLGRTKAERDAFVTCLVKRGRMAERSIRHVVAELRRTAAG